MSQDKEILNLFLAAKAAYARLLFLGLYEGRMTAQGQKELVNLRSSIAKISGKNEETIEAEASTDIEAIEQQKEEPKPEPIQIGHKYEMMDRVACIRESFHHLIEEHPAASLLKEQVEAVQDKLRDLYQAAGRLYFNTSEKEWLSDEVASSGWINFDDKINRPSPGQLILHRSPGGDNAMDIYREEDSGAWEGYWMPYPEFLTPPKTESED